MEWIDCKQKLPPKTGEKFLFKYHYGIGMGQYGPVYEHFNGDSWISNRERYVLILHPIVILSGEDPFEWDDEQMIEMEVLWSGLT